MADSPVDVEVQGRLARVRLNRPDAGNRVNIAMMKALLTALEQTAAGEVDVCLLSASGPDFCLGREQGERLPEHMTRRDSLSLILDVNAALSRCGAIIVTAAAGRAYGFGCGLVAQADLSIAADTAQFAFDEIHHGFAPAIVLTYLGDLLGPRRALDLTATGRAVCAEEAERIGLISRVAAADDLEAVAERVVGGLLELDRTALRECKRFQREVRQLPPEARPHHALSFMTSEK